MAAIICVSNIAALKGKRVTAVPSKHSCVWNPRLLVCCQVNKDSSSNLFSGLKDSVDKATKISISKEDILRKQEQQQQTEKQSVFGAVPKSSSFCPRPELDRRPDIGSRSFGSLLTFDGAAPETINGRLAMLGFVWALSAEKATGLTVVEQIFNPGTSGLVFFILAIQIFTYASLIPLLYGESTDGRSWGPFTARAERWNGRLAMIGFAALIIDEIIHQGPLIH